MKWRLMVLLAGLLALVALLGCVTYGVDEDFEPPLSYDWRTIDDPPFEHPWVLTTDHAHSGSWSVKSPQLKAGRLFVVLDGVQAGKLSFYYHFSFLTGRLKVCVGKWTSPNTFTGLCRFVYPPTTPAWGWYKFEWEIPNDWRTTGDDVCFMWEIEYLEEAEVYIDDVDFPPHGGTSPGTVRDSFGIFRGGWWFLDTDGAGGMAEQVVGFGGPGDLPVVGDWDGDGDDDLGIFRGGWWFLDTDGAGGFAENVIGFGGPGDLPVVGRWGVPGGGTGPSSAAVSPGTVSVLASPNPVTQDVVTFQVLGAQVDAVQVSIYDLAGTLVYRSGFVPGATVSWNLMSDRGAPVANGIYLYTVEAQIAGGEIVPTHFQELVVLR